ncbi:MAG TPA: DUF2207 domain-containing protein [Bacilli bacterium]|nr:MAG: hypothetical protein BWY97_01311 [Tenericutes bacterium ADurb.BinA124]HNZ50046.1 DUF2207 domain-containing protein [Bacilli bacterium]HPX84180.1 DUF2207 domain-containing protein [Bacilli bacterium]HQC74228.1 DUF2207 domain-containing protein [Bacilli bacterium]
MNKAKPAIIIFATFIVLFILMSLFAANGEIKVKSYDAEITLDNNGDMFISETWVVDWPTGKHVSFRDIAYQKYNPDNPLYQEETNVALFDNDSVNVAVFGKDGLALPKSQYKVGFSFKGDVDELGQPVECYPSRSNCESIFIYVDDGMQSTMTFKYDYKIIGAVTKYQDTNELNWVLLEYFESGVDDAMVTVNIPGVAKKDLQAWGHGLSKGKVIISDEKVVLDIDRIKPSEALEFRILINDDVFNVKPINFIDRAQYDEIVDYEVEWAKKTNLSIFLSFVVWVLAAAILIATVFVGVRVYIKYDKEYEPQFQGKYFRELPAEYSPAEMSYLYYFKKIQNEDVTATLLDLVRRKYLILDNNTSDINDKNPAFKITKNLAMNEDDLLPHEKHLISWFIDIVGDGKEVSLDQIEKYPKRSYQAAMKFEKAGSTFITLAKQAGSRHDFFEKTLASAKGKLYSWCFVPFVFTFLAFISGSMLAVPIDNTLPALMSALVGVAYVIYVATIKKRSVNGNEDYTKWKAFRQFLLDFGRMEDYPIPGVVVWEHYLVYATSLKVADKVMEQLEVKLPAEMIESEQATYMGIGYRYYGFRLGYALGRINQSVSTARANGRATIAAHQAQVSGSGRGGGFGGGRSFGGGGGGFRGR